jgi:glycosyltransferase involved in cell wall biosynthesis
MKLFFVHEVSYLDKVIFEMHEFPEILSIRSHEVYFYDFPEKSSRSGKNKCARTRVIPGRVHKNAKISLITPRTFLYGLMQRLLVIPYSFFHLYYKIKQTGPDVIITYAVPTYGLQILLIGKMLKIPILYRAIDVSHLIRESKLKTVINFLEKLVIRNSDFVSCNNLSMLNYVVSRGCKIENVSLDYAPIDFQHFKNAKKISNVNLKKLFFLGTLFPFSGLEEFISTANQSGLFKDGYIFTIVGSGERYDSLRNLIETLGLNDSVKMTGMIPYTSLSIHLESAGITLNPFKKSAVTDTALPQKVIQYAAAERPIVSSPLEGLVGLFDERETVFWASTPEEMVNTIRLINDMPLSELEERLERQSNHLASKLDAENVISSFESVLLRTKNSLR